MSRYSVCAASKPGSKHDFLEKNNQDACAVRLLDDGVVMAVCDGAGSRLYSRIGADTVSALAVSFLADIDWSVDFRPQAARFLSVAQTALAARAREMSLAAADLACTVLAIVVTSNGMRALQIGDGFIVTRSGLAEPYRLLFPISKGEYANETVFVTQDMAAAFMHVAMEDALPYFICLSTDGVERQAIKLRESEPHAPFFDYLCKVAASAEGKTYLEQFLTMPSLDEVTDDDRTIACAIQGRDGCSENARKAGR